MPARLIIAMLACLSVSSCAGMYQGVGEDPGWSRAMFRFNWPAGMEPDFSLDLLIADRVIRPTIENHETRVPLWRFHRRAARDEAGHQFSFIFLSDNRTADAIFREIEASSITHSLLTEELLSSIKFKQDELAQENNVGATSDPFWPEEIQSSWPYFIMGVSVSWLDHMDRIQREFSNPDQVSIDKMREYYLAVNKAMDEQWKEFGRQAYFHHLNAMYGYVPVYIHESGQYHRF